MILSKTFNDELQKYTTLDLLRMLKEYEDYNDSGVCDDGGIRGIIEYFINNEPSSKMLINNIKDKSYKIFHNNDTVFILCNNCQ